MQSFRVSANKTKTKKLANVYMRKKREHINFIKLKEYYITNEIF